MNNNIEWEHKKGVSTASRICEVSGEAYKVSLPTETFIRWQNREHIQHVAPELSADEREFLISGLTPAMFNDMFKDHEDYDN